jgi:hypothetical protein
MWQTGSLSSKGQMHEEQLREALVAAGHPPLLCGWFRAANTDMVELLTFLAMGAASVGSGGAAGGALGAVQDLFASDLHENKGMPHHVALAVSSDHVEVWGANEHHNLAELLATFSRGQFRAHFHHYPERVDVTLDDSRVRLVLTGSWTHFNDDCLKTARAAVDLATGPAY